MAAQVLAHQLIYTNVEADLSPSRQRGFQVWLCSQELTQDERRATAKRLDDFRIPPGGGSQDVTLARHVFFRLLASGLFVIARTVPSAERDKFGRGGKFHAHAIVIPENAFSRLDCNPFRVIDGGFRFHTTPAEAMAVDGWRSGTLPPVEIRAAEPSTQTLTFPDDRLVEWIDHLARADDKPLVIPDRPDRVLALLRGCFAALPPTVRGKIEFDTLSTGVSLAQIPYAAAGAFSPDNLKMWSFRRYHRLDLAAGICTPPLAAPRTALPGELIRIPGWRELSDPERDVLFAAAEALARGKLEEIPVCELSPEAMRVLEASPGIQESLDAAVQARLAKDLPAGLSRLPEVAEAVRNHFVGTPKEVLDRLAQPIAREVVAQALYDALGRASSPPEPDTLAGLGTWLLAGKAPPRLELIFRRWRGTDADLARIERVLTDPEDEPRRYRWFREWLDQTLPEGTAYDLIDRLSPGRPADPGAVRDARLCLALHPDPASPAWVDLHLLTALHRGAEVLKAALTGPSKPPGADGWLVRTAAARLRDRFRAGWMNDGMGGTFVGLFLVPIHECDETLLEVAEPLGAAVARRLLNALWPVGSGSFAPPEEADPPLEASLCYKRLMEAGPVDLSAATVALREHLLTADDEVYRWVGNQLLRKLYGMPILRAVTDDVTFVGLQLVWIQFDRPSHQYGVFEAVAGAAVPEVSLRRVPEVGGGIEPRAARRFSWLLARLADPNTTERLRV